MSELTHFDDQGASRMVDTSDKPETLRQARASGLVRLAPATTAMIRDRTVAKGDVLEVARVAGIMAAKRTGELIPLCHPLPVTAVGFSDSSPGQTLTYHWSWTGTNGQKTVTTASCHDDGALSGRRCWMRANSCSQSLLMSAILA